jgi:hypothetical protein
MSTPVIFSGSFECRHATRPRHEALCLVVIMPGPAAPMAGERAKAQGTEVKDRGRAPAGLAVQFKAATGQQA